LRSFFLGSNKVLQVALGRTPDDEHRPGLSALAARLRGDTGLLFTNMERNELETALEDAATAHHARAGTTAEESVELDAGPLMFKARSQHMHGCIMLCLI
jgi:mRNA turnover protein 4